jgi:hypothetical protein
MLSTRIERRPATYVPAVACRRAKKATMISTHLAVVLMPAATACNPGSVGSRPGAGGGPNAMALATQGSFLTVQRTCVTIEPADSRRIEMLMRVPLRRDVSGERLMPQPRSRMRRRALVVAVFVSAVMLAVVPWAGAGTLDQSQSGIGSVRALLSERNIWAQTFTNGVSGGLDQVDLAVGRQGAQTTPLQVEIRAVSGGVPSGPALASATVPAASLPRFGTVGFFSVPLTSPAPVTAGAQYAIVVSTPSCGFSNCYVWALGPGANPYPAGLGLVTQDGGATWTPVNAFGATDFAFKTYVLPPPTGKQQCKKGGWKQFRNPSFKNQGQCVKYANHHGTMSSKGKDDEKGQGKKKPGKK